MEEHVSNIDSTVEVQRSGMQSSDPSTKLEQKMLRLFTFIRLYVETF